jgi:hypothetical protein
MEAKQSIESAVFDPTSSGFPSSSLKTFMPMSPLRAAIYLWVGGFWTWVLVHCLSDHYPILKALVHAIT